MAILPILKMGDARLYEVSKAFELSEIAKSSTTQLIADMLDTMRAANGAGLAAPQIGVAKRLVIFELKNNPRYPNHTISLQILFNPHIAPLTTDKSVDFEGCLSVPGLRAKIPRYTKIRYSGYNEKGEAVLVDAEDFHARVVQHEVDHLDGVLFPQRVEDHHFFGFIDALSQVDKPTTED